MAISDKDKAALRYLTYPVQFSFPMKKGIERVFQTLIDPSIPFRSTAEILRKVESLREIQEPLADTVTTTTGHQESEIREYLDTLAIQIEDRYPNILRSGRPVVKSGIWFQIDKPEQAKNFFAGEILPSSDDIVLLWEYQVPRLSMQAAEAIKSELVTYYRKSVINTMPEYEGPDKYADASAARIRHCLSNSELAKASMLLQELSIAPDSPLIQEVQTLTGVKWLNDDIYRVWLQEVFHRISLNLRQEYS